MQAARRYYEQAAAAAPNPPPPGYGNKGGGFVPWWGKKGGGGSMRFSPYANGGVGGGSDNETNLWVGSLPEHIDDAALSQMFGQFGTVVSLKVMPGKGFG